MSMDDQELLAFLQKILITSSEKKASYTLSQLKDILSDQRAPQRQLEMIRRTILDFPEARELALQRKTAPLTGQDLAIAAERAERRRQRERELEDQGRC